MAPADLTQLFQAIIVVLIVVGLISALVYIIRSLSGDGGGAPGGDE